MYSFLNLDMLQMRIVWFKVEAVLEDILPDMDLDIGQLLEIIVVTSLWSIQLYTSSQGCAIGFGCG